MEFDFPWLEPVVKRSSQTPGECLEKEMLPIGAAITEPLCIEWGKIRMEISPLEDFLISNTLFERSYSCLDYSGCSRCCYGFLMFFLVDTLTDSQRKHILKSERAKPTSMFFNGVKKEYLVEDHRKGACSFLKPIAGLGHTEENGRKGCSIHKFNPLSCQFPLVFFARDEKRGKVRINKRVFSRNHFMRCPVKWETRGHQSGKEGLEEFRKTTLPRLQKWKSYLDCLGVEHRAGSMLEFIEKEALKVLGIKKKCFFGE